MRGYLSRSFRAPLGALILFGLGLAPAGAQLNEAKGQVEQKTREGAQAQAEINRLDDQRDVTEADYRRALTELEGLQLYNDQQRRLIAKQEEDMVQIRGQLEQIATLTRDLTPLMLRMLDTVEQFIALDLPFLLEGDRGRLARIENVRALMDDPNKTPADRYRGVLDVYLNEIDYGRTIQTYEGTLAIEGNPRNVEFLRIGRIGYYYQTPDQEESGVFDPGTRQWVELPSRYNQPIRTGIKMAREIVPPDVMVLPVPISKNLKSAE